MKKFLFIILVATVFLNTACEKDFLNVSSPSAVDQIFVFSSPDEAYKVLMGNYERWREGNNGLFYDLDIVGSDIECHPETYDAQVRHIPEGLYAAEIPINYSNSVNIWANLYQVASRANIIMDEIAKVADYQSAVASGTPNTWTQLYGEAAVFRAYAYFNLIRYFGDVPYYNEPIVSTSQTDTAKLISRDIIYDGEIESLKAAEPLMFRLGENGITAERFSRTFAQGLIGKMALFAGGYSLRRTDFNYGTVTFEQKGIEQWNAKYVRRTDYKDYYEIARDYLQACVDDPGSASLINSDPRGAGFDNPFQYNFQLNMDLKVSSESIYEVGYTQGKGLGSSERPYAFGRPSNGGGSNAYPCKGYGQSRMYASFYYGDFAPQDLRRDVTTTVTINSGACSEVIVDFAPGSRNKGGLPNNKWDESRMDKPFTTAQRSSGVNWPQMRMADVILLLAEAYAELDDEAAAKAELTKVRSRAFKADDQATMVTDYIAALSGDDLKEAILDERCLELAGEGFRRYDLIRTGKLPDKIKERRDLQTAMVAGLESQGYYTFPNGNTIPAYIWIKAVNVDSLGMTKMLTTQCTVDETDPTYPVRFPGWRGNCDKWSQFTPVTGKRNLAIEGLFEYIDPAGAEAAALEADGYKKTKWGANIVANKDQYTTNIFKGYPDDYVSSGVPPRYLLPLSSETISKSNGLISNGYGFAQE